MSKSIQELADQCWLEKFHLNEEHDYYEFDYEKFAKLILEECSQAFENALQNDIDEDYHLRHHPSYYFEKHFGVKL